MLATRLEKWHKLRKVKRFLLILFLLLFYVVSFSEGSALYKWKDGKGGVHVTDVPPPSGSYETIGKKERNEKSNTPPESSRELEKGAASRTTTRKTPAPAYIPLRRAGNHFLVKMGINSRTAGLFLLDTGATLTVIAPQIAQEGGILLSGDLPIIPLKTASGLIFPPLARVEKFTLGDLTLPGGDVVVHDIHFGKGVSGLVGMDLLSDYQITLDTQRAVLVLKPVHRAGPTYGGHSRRWWQGKFAFYRHTLQSLENLRQVPERALNPYHVDREKIEESIEYFQDRLIRLKSLAEDDLVPLGWRK